jgi:hypothetical protein
MKRRGGTVVQSQKVEVAASPTGGAFLLGRTRAFQQLLKVRSQTAMYLMFPSSVTPTRAMRFVSKVLGITWAAQAVAHPLGLASASR